jgi:hypothetical protein
MMAAFWWMSRNPLNHHLITSRAFSIAKTYLAESKRGIPRTKEVRDKISNTLKSKESGWTQWNGRKHSLESKLKMSKSASERKRSPMSNETKRKISQAHTGKKYSHERIENMKGIVVSEETKRKMSQARCGKALSKIHIANVSKALKGKPWSDARRAAHNLKKLHSTEG